MVDGKLQPSSLDVYIAMEFGSDGDLFNLRCLPIAHVFVAWPKHNGERGLPFCKAGMSRANSAAGKTRHATHHSFTLCCLHC